MNDAEREQWVNNDEPLYTWWKSTLLGLRPFVRANRDEIDARISDELNRPPRS